MRSITLAGLLRASALCMLAALGAAREAHSATVTVNLTAQRSSTTLPDGAVVPMWGFCTTPAAGGPCAGDWAPGPTIVASPGDTLTINLTNQLPTPTSIVILGQIGGGLGAAQFDPAANFNHPSVSTTTLFANTAVAPGTEFTPPAQGPRVRAFAPEAGVAGSLSNTQTYTWPALKAGTYLYETGTHPSVQAPMGLYGVLIVTTAPVPTPATPGTAYAGISYDADALALFSEIDPVWNKAIDAIAAGVPAGAAINESQYPPAVNYSPTYFLLNGQGYDRTIPNNSLSFAAATTSGKSLLRLANAGLRTHVAEVVGLGLELVAEDGNLAPGNHKLQSVALLPAGKTVDALLSFPSVNNSVNGVYPIFDRQLSLSGGSQSDIGIIGAVVAGAGVAGAVDVAHAVADVFTVNGAATTFSSNVLTNDVGVRGAALSGSAPGAPAVLTLNADGSFTISGVTDWTKAGFSYCGNGASSGILCAKVSFVPFGGKAGAPTAVADSFTSASSGKLITVPHPGVLANDTSPNGLKLTAVIDNAAASNTCATVSLNADGSFTATTATAGTACHFNYFAVNDQGVVSASSATVTVSFPTPTPGLSLTVQDATMDVVNNVAVHTPITDYAWTVEEDLTYQSDPAQAKPGPDPNELSVNFHKSAMPLVATGCTGISSCKGNQSYGGVQATPGQRIPQSRFEDLRLDPAKRYFISILPGDAGAGAGNPGNPAANPPVPPVAPGHTTGGVSIAAGQTSVVVNLERQPLPTGACVVRVFEDNRPTNGAPDAEDGLGGFEVYMIDARGSTGDAAGQMTYDAFAQPLTNALANKVAPDGTNLCPLTTVGPTPYLSAGAAPGSSDAKIGVIYTCPATDSANRPSPYAGIALVNHLMQGRFDVTARPGASRIAKGERWLQTSTLEGTPAIECFVQAGDPTATANIGFVNPDHVAQVNKGLNGTNDVTGRITNQRFDRPPGQGIYDSGGREAQGFTRCEVGLSANAGDGETIAMTECDDQGNFDLKNVPSGTYGLFVFDQWLDQIINLGQVVIVPPSARQQTIRLGDIPVNMWFGRIEHSAYLDGPNNSSSGIASLPITVRFRDGGISNRLLTNSDGQAAQNEYFPLPAWAVVESDTTRFKGGSVLVTTDAGGRADASGPFKGVLNSTETFPLPAGLEYPGSTHPTPGRTTRRDPGTVLSEGVQLQTGMTNHIEWHKVPYGPGENGGITGTVTYATTRGFDNPQEAVQATWQSLIPRVQVNLYRKTTNADGSTSLALVDSTRTSSWDDGVTAMHCPGQADANADPLVSNTLGDNGTNNARWKCYDGYHNFNQMQPAQYDGRYQFPTAACTACTTNPVDQGKMLPAGSYVVEVVPPQGYEVIKEEDKDLLDGDAWLDPGTGSQFAATGQIFILADQATLAADGSLAYVGPAKGNLFPPCVGAPHLVPDFLSIAPDQQFVAPFAGQVRPLCDRKEVRLNDGGQVPANFSLFTYAPVAGHFQGIELNDLGATFSKISPVFGEKAGIPFSPVSFRDFAGLEVQRVYTDRWGSFDGIFPTSWEVNPSDPSGYSPMMHLVCMNDPGPILDKDPNSPTYGQMITDPQHDPNFTNFCFPWGSLAQVTTYIDNPVLPAAAFAGGGDPADCAYPDATPAIRRVDGDGGEGQASFGPYVSSGGRRQLVIQALGDQAVPNPLYGGPTEIDPLGAHKTVTRHFGFGTFTDGKSQVALRSDSGRMYPLPVGAGNWTDMRITASVPGGAGGVPNGHYELVITAANGLTSVDTVTVWVGGRAPSYYVKPADPAATLSGVGGALPHPIQDAIDAASPGDLIMLDAGAYHELVLMWKPVRLQGVGAASVVISGGKKPSKNLQTWQLRVNYLFGLDENSNPIPGVTPRVDLLPGEVPAVAAQLGILAGGSSILSSYEGQTITVLAEADGRDPLAAAPCRPGDATACGPTAPFRDALNPSIDGITVTAGDGGGGIHVHGWAHGLDIANTRIRGNSGVNGGGLSIGVPNLGNPLPVNGRGFGYNRGLNIHNNAITSNGSLEANVGLGSVTPGGGLALCTGTDNYAVNYNFICGNFSQNDGGGIGHLGYSVNGRIDHNFILFNQTYNPTWATHGGGITVMAETASPLQGVGRTSIDSNVILGNFAQSGSGGGVRVQSSNRDPVSVTNNMITNNVAAWAGGGVSLSDALRVRVSNNTIASNDTVAMYGGLFNTQVGAVNTGANVSVANPAGLSSEITSAALLAALPANMRNASLISRPTSFVNNILWHNRSFLTDQTGRDPRSNGDPVLRPSNRWLDSVSNPLPAMLADQTATGQCTATAQYWDIGVIGDRSVTPAANAQLRLNPRFSVLSENLATVNAYNLPATGNLFADPGLVRVYCNGARRAPELNPDPNQPNRFILANVGDEGGNSYDLRYGPLSLLNQVTTLNKADRAAAGAVIIGNYNILNAGAAYNNGTDADDGATARDIYGTLRPQFGKYDIGAHEYAGP